MKKIRRCVSILTVVALLATCVSVSVSATETSITGAQYTKYGENYDHTAEWYFGDNGRMVDGVLDELYLETVDNIDYIYMVEDGEAYIVNVHFSDRGIQGRTLTLPEKLGTYPVVALGHPQYKFWIFWYITYGESFDEFSKYYPWISSWLSHDYDPEMYYVEKIIVPKGCKYIYEYALTGYSGSFEFPKSLRLVEDYYYENEYITGVDSFIGENTFIVPDCEFGTNFDVSIKCDYYIFSSRFPATRMDTTYVVPKAICIPSNLSAESAKFVLFPRNTIGINETLKDTVIYCSEDSPTYAVLQENKSRGEYTVVTDIPKAEYIDFPEENVNIHVGDVVDLEAKTYPSEAIWTACDYLSSDPSIVEIDEYSGRITALKEGTVTITATHCERGYVDTCTVNVTPEPVPGVNGIEPATDTPYVTYGNRDYKIDVTGSPSKIQVVRDNGGTTTIDRRKATVTSNGDTETWIVNMRVEAGTHNIRAKYGNVWEPRLTPFTVTYDLPGAYSFDLSCENSIGTFDVVTDPEVIKVQFLLDNGCTLTYHQGYSYIGDDGLRHWTVTRKLPEGMRYTLRTKYGYTWTTTDFSVIS